MKDLLRVALAVSLKLVVCSFATMAHPGSGIVVDARGRVFFNEAGDPDERLPGSIWQLDAQGRLSRLQVGGAHYLALDLKRGFAKSDLARWVSERATPWLQRADTPEAALLQADGQPLAFHQDGSLYFAKRNLEVIRLAPDGTQQSVAPPLVPVVEQLGGIKGLAFGPTNDLYVACPGAILRLKPDGTFSAMIGSIVVPDCDPEFPPDLPASQSPFLRGLAVDAHGTVFAAATGCRAVVRISPEGQASVALRAEAPWSPTGVAVHGNDVYVLEYEHPHSPRKVDWRPRVRTLGHDGQVRTLVTLPTAQSRPPAPSPGQ